MGSKQTLVPVNFANTASPVCTVPLLVHPFSQLESRLCVLGVRLGCHDDPHKARELGSDLKQVRAEMAVKVGVARAAEKAVDQEASAKTEGIALRLGRARGGTPELRLVAASRQAMLVRPNDVGAPTLE